MQSYSKFVFHIALATNRKMDMRLSLCMVKCRVRKNTAYCYTSLALTSYISEPESIMKSLSKLPSSLPQMAGALM